MTAFPSRWPVMTRLMPPPAYDYFMKGGRFPKDCFAPLAMTRLLLELEVDEDAPEVLVVLFQAVVELLHVRLVEEAEHLLLELARPLAGDDLHRGDALVERLVHNAAEGFVDFPAPVVDFLQVGAELGRG